MGSESAGLTSLASIFWALIRGRSWSELPERLPDHAG